MSSGVWTNTILNGVIQQHLTKYLLTETDVVSQLAESLYVDDFTGGTHNVEEGFHLYQSSKELMQKGGFNLHKWRTNSAILQEMINREEGNMSPNDQEEMKILGVIWNVNSGEFQDFQGISLVTYNRHLVSVQF